mgnify:CR=1 FL=1
MDNSRLAKCLDYTVIAVCMCYTLVVLILVLLASVEMLEYWGAILILVTHIMITFSFIDVLVLQPVASRGWYTLVLIVSFVISILFHVSKLWVTSAEFVFDRADITAQNVLIVSTICVILDENIDKYNNLLTTIAVSVSGVIVAVFGDIEFFGVKLFIWLTSILFLIIIGYAISKWKQDMHVRWAIGSSLVAGFAYILATPSVLWNTPTHLYSIIHSVWHVAAYSTLYLMLRSLHAAKTPPASAPDSPKEERITRSRRKWNELDPI